MPELPEVETVRRGLHELTAGRVLTRLEALHPRVWRHQPEGLALLERQVAGRRVEQVARHGKFLWFVLSPPTPGEPLALVAHLGMSGQFRLVNPDHPHGAHLRAVLHLDGSAQQLHFLDQRTFGALYTDTLVAAPGIGYPPLLPSRLARLGPDPFAPGFDPRVAAALLARTTRAIKTALLDQTFLAGVGNIYADEALWRCRLAPTHPAHTLGLQRLVELVTAATQVMAESLARGGTSFDALYVNVNGDSGRNSEHLQVYGRAGLPCLCCGTTLVRTVVAARGSVSCPLCQTARQQDGL